MRSSFTDPDETCDEGEPDDTGGRELKTYEALTMVDGEWFARHRFTGELRAMWKRPATEAQAAE